MSTYVISDIHGYYDVFFELLVKVNFSDTDILILAGDYIDRGPQNFEMLKWIEKCPDNVIPLCGNHDIEFAYNVELLNQFAKDDMDMDSNEETLQLYALFSQAAKKKSGGNSIFDYYGTIGELISVYGATLNQLLDWTDCIWDMEYFHALEIDGRKFIIVHAGYTEELDNENMDSQYETLEDFYVYARDDAYINGGAAHSVIIAGHTPTIFEEVLPYNAGNVYKCYDEDMDCTFYDIDCGCAYRDKAKNAKLACIRLDDEQIFYA